MEYRSPEREREHRAKLDEIGSTIGSHEFYVHSVICTQLTTKAIIYNLHEPQFNCENLSSYAHMPTCARRRPGCSAYYRRHMGITL